VGRRDEHKEATRAALQEAADRLFAERGFEATGVRDIADAAGVTERTFFRYYASKEDLLIPSVLAWLPVLADGIAARPPEEPPLTAVRRAVGALADRLAGSASLDDHAVVLLFRGGPPAQRLGSLARTMLLQIEQAIGAALRPRLADVPDPEYVADVTARVALAVLRSALIRDWQLRERGTGTDRASLQELVDSGFGALGPGIGLPPA
jgi:AcrR family transcriptional regulator